MVDRPGDGGEPGVVIPADHPAIPALPNSYVQHGRDGEVRSAAVRLLSPLRSAHGETIYRSPISNSLFFIALGPA